MWSAAFTPLQLPNVQGRKDWPANFRTLKRRERRAPANMLRLDQRPQPRAAFNVPLPCHFAYFVV